MWTEAAKLWGWSRLEAIYESELHLLILCVEIALGTERQRLSGVFHVLWNYLFDLCF